MFDRNGLFLESSIARRMTSSGRQRRLEEDLTGLYELDDRHFRVDFPDPLRRDAFVLVVKSSEELRISDDVTFAFEVPQQYPRCPPKVTKGTGVNVPRVRMLDRDVWMFNYRLDCVAHALRRALYKKKRTRTRVRHIGRTTSTADSTSKGGVAIVASRGYVYERRGRRRSMEDASVCMDRIPIPSIKGFVKSSMPVGFYAVYDGHGGSEASKFVGRTMPSFVSRYIGEGLSGADALSLAFVETDDAFLSRATGRTSNRGLNRSKTADSLFDDIMSSPSGFNGEDNLVLSEDEDNGVDDPLVGSIAGTCAVCVLVDIPKQCLWIANAGDSRAVLCRNGKAIALSRDHKPVCSDEIARIVEAGGFVTMGRTNGQLAVSRALGDRRFKSSDDDSPRHESGAHVVSATPEITQISLERDDEFIVIACDGLFDVMSNEEVVRFVRDSIGRSGRLKNASEIAAELVNHAINTLHSNDNVSVIVVALDTTMSDSARTTNRTNSPSSESSSIERHTLKLSLDDVESPPKTSSIDDLLEYASSPTHIASRKQARQGGPSTSFFSKTTKPQRSKKRTSPQSRRRKSCDLQGLDDSGLLDYLMDDNNFRS